VILEDQFDNHPDSNAPEALYAQGLIVNPGSELCLSGLHLYVNGAMVNPGDGALYGGGDIEAAVPEPATLVLLALGGVMLMARRLGRKGVVALPRPQA
jgi:hypothetical protein